MQAKHAYSIDMNTIQYTIRGVPAAIDQTARELARQKHCSLNTVLLEVLSRGLGPAKPVANHDLDDLAGTWVADPEFDRAMAVFEAVDEDLWK